MRLTNGMFTLFTCQKATVARLPWVPLQRHCTTLDHGPHGTCVHAALSSNNGRPDELYGTNNCWLVYLVLACWFIYSHRFKGPKIVWEMLNLSQDLEVEAARYHH
jgi:hypothetical protein